MLFLWLSYEENRALTLFICHHVRSSERHFCCCGDLWFPMCSSFLYVFTSTILHCLEDTCHTFCYILSLMDTLLPPIALLCLPSPQHLILFPLSTDSPPLSTDSPPLFLLTLPLFLLTLPLVLPTLPVLSHLFSVLKFSRSAPPLSSTNHRSPRVE